jgi:hypothetical protein
MDAKTPNKSIDVITFPSRVKITVCAGPDAVAAVAHLKRILQSCEVPSHWLECLGCGERDPNVVDVPDAGPWHRHCAAAYMAKIDGRKA